MAELIWKDIIVARWFLALFFPLYALQLAVAAGQPHIFFLLTILFTAPLGFGPIILEEQQRTESLWCSLPIIRRDIVLARYVTAILGLTAGLGLSWGIGCAEGVPGLLVVPFLFSVLGLLTAGYLPCYFRYGAGKGMVVFSSIALALLIILPLLTQLLLWIAGMANPLLNPELWRGNAAELIGEDRLRFFGPAAGILVPITLATLLASAALSVRFYEARDL